MINTSISIAKIEEISKLLNLDFYNIMQMSRCKSQDDFISFLYEDLEKIIRIIEEDPGARRDDDEDRITQEVVLGLKMRGYDASHDTFHGGHCDIVVKLNKYTWLGEAKIHSNYDHLMQGFNQLFSRYSSGTDFCNQGAIIVYCKRKNTLDVMTKWKTELIKKFGKKSISDKICSYRESLSFYSTHIHESSGLRYIVKHIFVVLHFDPQDKKS